MVFIKQDINNSEVLYLDCQGIHFDQGYQDCLFFLGYLADLRFLCDLGIQLVLAILYLGDLAYLTKRKW